MIKVQPFIQKIDCKDASEFLDTISPRGRLFRGRESAGSARDLTDVVIFRGHSDSRFTLVPSALRINGPLERFVRYTPKTTGDQIRAEAEIIRRFFSLADSAGLSLPEDSQSLRKHIMKSSRFEYPDTLASSNSTWPPEELLSLIGIAQHYGLPTRLLDWTRSHLTAAYFAATGAVKEVKRAQSKGSARGIKRRKLSVWAFEYSRYLASKSGRYVGRSYEFDLTPPSVELITAPRSGNPNLHAQDGIFTLFRPQNISPEADVDRRSLNTQIKEAAELAARPITIFYEITLPIICSSNLMWLLAKEGTSAARLFPGYGGVVQALEEEG